MHDLPSSAFGHIFEGTGPDPSLPEVSKHGDGPRRATVGRFAIG